MTWKELVNFVQHHKDDVEPESEVEFEDNTLPHFITPVKTIYFANATPCSKCNHKHNVVRLRSVFEN